MSEDRLGWLDRQVFKMVGIDPVNNRLAYFRTMIGIYWLGAVSLGLIVVICATWCQSTMTAVMWALASAISMALLGFLFGIPKTAQEGAVPRPEPGGKLPNVIDTLPPGPAGALPTRIRHFVNTNLEDISDWLTKIIVGAALIEWRPLLDALDRGARTLAGALSSGGADQARDLALAYAIMVYFGATDFLFGYLFTRLFLAEAFTLADAQATVQRLDAELEKVKSTVGALREKVNETTPAPRKV